MARLSVLFICLLWVIQCNAAFSPFDFEAQLSPAAAEALRNNREAAGTQRALTGSLKLPALAPWLRVGGNLDYGQIKRGTLTMVTASAGLSVAAEFMFFSVELTFKGSINAFSAETQSPDEIVTAVITDLVSRKSKPENAKPLWELLWDGVGIFGFEPTVHQTASFIQSSASGWQRLASQQKWSEIKSELDEQIDRHWSVEALQNPLRMLMDYYKKEYQSDNPSFQIPANINWGPIVAEVRAMFCYSFGVSSTLESLQKLIQNPADAAAAGVVNGQLQQWDRWRDRTQRENTIAVTKEVFRERFDLRALHEQSLLAALPADASPGQRARALTNSAKASMARTDTNPVYVTYEVFGEIAIKFSLSNTAASWAKSPLKPSTAFSASFTGQFFPFGLRVGMNVNSAYNAPAADPRIYTTSFWGYGGGFDIKIGTASLSAGIVKKVYKQSNNRPTYVIRAEIKLPFDAPVATPEEFYRIAALREIFMHSSTALYRAIKDGFAAANIGRIVDGSQLRQGQVPAADATFFNSFAGNIQQVWPQLLAGAPGLLLKPGNAVSGLKSKLVLGLNTLAMCGYTVGTGEIRSCTDFSKWFVFPHVTIEMGASIENSVANRLPISGGVDYNFGFNILLSEAWKNAPVTNPTGNSTVAASLSPNPTTNPVLTGSLSPSPSPSATRNRNTNAFSNTVSNILGPVGGPNPVVPPPTESPSTLPNRNTVTNVLGPVGVGGGPKPTTNPVPSPAPSPRGGFSLSNTISKIFSFGRG